ncbi:MAG: hypothetical protein M1821_002058 [Bathelium mastoideum]|nr:MAG: hypothetical protein M1821_002058 [Bathelium mastoideum]
MSGGYSAFALFTAALAALASSALALESLPHAPTDNKGNPTTAPVKYENITLGSRYDIKWNSTQQPAGCGRVSLRLLSGCPSNCVQEGDLIAKSISNNGLDSWIVPSALTPDAPGQFTHGIQIVCDNNGDYQWSPNFALVRSSVPTPPSNTTSSSCSSSSFSTSSQSPTPITTTETRCFPSADASFCTTRTAPSISVPSVSLPGNLSAPIATSTSTTLGGGSGSSGSSNSTGAFGGAPTANRSGGLTGPSPSVPLSANPNGAAKVTGAGAGAGAGLVMVAVVAAMLL